MKIAAITFFGKDNMEQTILGMCEYDRTRCPEVDNESCFRYQIRSNDDGSGNPATIEAAVAVNHLADFITDTKIDFPNKENAGEGYALISDDIDEYGDKVFDMNSFNLMNELEAFRKSQLTEYLRGNLAEVNEGDPIVNHIDTDRDGNIHLNFYGVPYTLEIHNDKEFE